MSRSVEINMPGFNAEASLGGKVGHYHGAARSSTHQQIVPQSKDTCAFKAGRLAGRCLAAGIYDRYDCYALAADFNQFCNEYDL